VKVAYVSAGAGGMYCGSCLHDNALAGALIRQGHDVALIPTWTPMRTDDRDVSIDRVFYGAINAWLAQKLGVFRHTPWLLDRLLNGKRLLGWASARGSTVDASLLGGMTLSVLEGEAGHHRKELDRLVAWLAEFRPEIVHLTNSMFLGMAQRIRAELDVPVLCSLQGEDLFVDRLSEPWRERVHALLCAKALDVDLHLAATRFYADAMASWLGVPRERMRVVPLGINVRGHRAVDRADGPFVVGYLARIAPEKGLHLLVEAFRTLGDRVGRDRVRLRIAGWLGPGDRAWFDGVRRAVDQAGLAGAVDVVGEVDRAGKLAFLESIDVMSVPTTYRDPKGLSILEALASGVPVVQPAHGAFPELVESTGGGVLVEPGSTEALAGALEALFRDPARRRELGLRGREAVLRERTDDRMAERTLEVYADCLAPGLRAANA
jgi:glycosyltransferase involved in cell wall biosynthesis